MWSASPSVGAGRPDWWNPAWKYRQCVQVSTPDKTNRINTALAVIDTLGNSAPKGADIRVLDEKNQPRPYHVVSEKNGVVRVQFQVPDGAVRKYWVYYGNKSGQPAETPWNKVMGKLTLETWRYPSRQSPSSWSHMIKMRDKIQKETQRLGIGQREWINERENPFGENDYYMAIYNGEIFCPETGEYGFATNSDDASFLLVNGNLVAEWPYGHEESRRWDHKGTIALERGIHRITYYLVENTGGQLARAGWKLPSEKYFSTIPKDAYVHELRTEVVSYEQYESNISCYFTCDRAQSIRFNTDERDFVTMSFRDCSTSAIGKVAYWDWRFGDGGASLEKNPRHEYLRAGKYKVTLHTKDDLGYEAACTREIEIAGQDPERITVRFDIEKSRNIVMATEPLVLNLRFRSSSEEPLPLTLDTRVEDMNGGLLSLERDAMKLQEDQWFPIRRSYPPRLGKHELKYTLNYRDIPIVRQKLVVIPAPDVKTRLGIHHNSLVDGEGNLVVLRTVESVAQGTRELLRRKLREDRPLKVVVFDDSLGPVAPGKKSYRDLLKEKISEGGRRQVEMKLAGQTQGASEFPLFVRLCDFPVDVVAEDPDIIIIVCSITDVLNYVPIEMYRRYVSVLVDQALAKPKAAILLVCPPPLVMKPDLSRDYAYATLQLGQLKRLPVVDLFSAFSNMGTHWRKLFQDDQYQEDPVYCLYPNSEGQRIIAEKIYQKMIED
ncbi:MAG: PKD domain-containing protein [Planctomycetes bacterium]|nr:PKD domain-containing protein [Planctomycetota bacterium]